MSPIRPSLRCDDRLTGRYRVGMAGTREPVGLPTAERLKAFADAVVAIAMTLLILPLMESVSDAGAGSGSVETWLREEWSALVTFALSFVLIANFWITHHRLFKRVDSVDSSLLWLSVAWMFTIVWLPVATAITTAFDDDPLQETIYIGSLAVTSIVLNLTRVYLARHPMLHSESKDDLRRGLVTGWVITALFLVALAVALVVPVIGYSALFLLFLTQPISAFLVRRIGDA